MRSEDAAAFERCVAGGGVAVFPADTVYGLACRPDSDDALGRLYGLKGRPPGKPAAVMFFALDRALAAVNDAGERTTVALRRLLPGGVTVLLPNPAHRFAPACGSDPDTLGLRVPALPASLAALADVAAPIAQSSANLTGGPAPRTVAEVSARLRWGADLVLDGGELPGTASTVLDMRRYEDDGTWRIERPGAVGEAELRAALD